MKYNASTNLRRGLMTKKVCNRPLAKDASPKSKKEYIRRQAEAKQELASMKEKIFIKKNRNYTDRIEEK